MDELSIRLQVDRVANVLPMLTALATASVTTGFLGLAGWRLTVVSSNFLALLLILPVMLLIYLRDARAIAPILAEHAVWRREQATPPDDGDEA